MRLVELIARLTELNREYGDLKVYTNVEDWMEPMSGLEIQGAPTGEQQVWIV